MNLQEFKCPNCGGSVSFNSEKQKLVCDYCKTEYDIDSELFHEHNHDHDHSHIDDEDTPKETVTETVDSKGAKWEQEKEFFSKEEEKDLTVYSCNSCGGEIIGDKTTGATSCPFCKNNVVIPSQFSGDLKPDFVIPFKLNREDAKRALRNFYKGRKLLPKVFSSENNIEEIKGIYVPFWLYSGTSKAQLVFTGTKVRIYEDSNYRYTETSYYDIDRGGTMDFKYVPVDGSTKIDDTMMESIEPYKWDEAMNFTTQFLAGYLANRYDIEAKECIGVAEGRIKNSTLQTFRNSVSGYSTLNIRNQSYDLGKVEINYALAPVWFLNTKWNGNYYTFAMNGQTGKIVGDDLPIDKGLYWRKLITIGSIIGIIIFILLFFMYPFMR